jgi:hypothetical protein
MPIRFRRSFKIFPWFKINVSKSGISETVGSKGFHLTFGKRGVRQSIGLPGTGLSESSYILQNEQKSEHPTQSEHMQQPPVETPLVAQGSPTSKFVLILVGLIGVACLCLAFTLFGLNPLQGFSQWIASLNL